MLGTRVESVDVGQKTLLIASGETIRYDTLIIATGAKVLKLSSSQMIKDKVEN